MLTHKAKNIMQTMKPGKLFRDPKERGRIMEEFNHDNSPEVKPLGGERGLAVLSDLVAGYVASVKNLAPDEARSAIQRLL